MSGNLHKEMSKGSGMTSVSEKLSLPIRIDSGGYVGHLDGVNVPLRFGVPLPRGRMIFPCEARLLAPTGEVFPTQMIPLAKWPDGSVRWMRVDTIVRAQVGSRLSETRRRP